MSFEKQSQNPYEPMIKAADGSFVRESELDRYGKNLNSKKGVDKDFVEDKSILENTEQKSEKKKGISRRTFLKGVGGAVVIGAVSGSGALDNIDIKDLSKKTEAFVSSVAKRFEKSRINLDPLEQFIKYGKIKNLRGGIEAVKDEHFKYLTEETRGVDSAGVPIENPGVNDMKMATENLRSSVHDMNRFTKPFVDVGLPPQLCYMIAIQETRGKNVTSWAGARGVMGIMPKTAEAYGYVAKDVEDPYVASKVAAKYCRDENTRFDEGDMILHAYNGGAGLCGFTRKTPRPERTAENFYDYMEKYMNTKYNEIKDHGFIETRVRKGDTLSKISKKWNIPLSEVLELNNIDEHSPINVGDKVKVRFENSEKMLKKIFSKELEILRYTPEIKAKYDALKEQGLLTALESGLSKNVSSFG